MGLRRKPHTVQIHTATEPVQGDRSVDKPTYTPGATVSVQITALSAGRAYDLFGIETSRPHLCLGDLGDLGGLQIGDRLVFGTRTFAVTASRLTRSAGRATDHVALLIDELQFQP